MTEYDNGKDCSQPQYWAAQCGHKRIIAKVSPELRLSELSSKPVAQDLCPGISASCLIANDFALMRHVNNI